jgi:hypothetical protein
MRCKVIVLIALPTMDSLAELVENRISLKRKYEKRGQTCIEVDLPREKIPNLSGKGTVGVYVLSHTKDVKPVELARTLFDQMIAVGTDVRKINIACCRAAAGQGPMVPFCRELEKCQTGTLTLPVDLMVCGFNVNVTTFDSESEFIAKEGAKFVNFQQVKQSAAADQREVGTVKQNWAPVGSGGPSFMYFVHEKMGSGQTPTFILEAEKLFQQQLDAEWNRDRADFIGTKFNPNQRPAKKILEPEKCTWSEFATEHEAAARLYVKSVFWDKFIAGIATVNHRSAAMWVSLDGYVNMKKVMRFNGKRFEAVALSEYAENDDMKQALGFVEGVQGKKGVTLRFLPEV